MSKRLIFLGIGIVVVQGCLYSLNTEAATKSEESSKSKAGALPIFPVAPIAPTSPQVETGLDISALDKEVTISKGSFWLNDKLIHVANEQKLAIEPCQNIVVKDELLRFQKNGQGFLAVPSLCRASKTDMAVLSGVVMPASLELRSAPDTSGTVFKKGKEYFVDEQSGSIVVPKDSPIVNASTIYASYQALTQRLDTVAIDEQGNCKIIKGVPVRSAPMAPNVSANEFALANIHMRKGNPALGAQDILPILSRKVPSLRQDRLAKNQQALTRCLELIKSGKPIRIAFWGDSITQGADSSAPGLSFVSQVLNKFSLEYPKVAIHPINVGIGGTNTNNRLKDFAKEVLSKKPDLIVVEFENDIRLVPADLEANYQALFEQATKAGAEILLVSPHLPSPHLLGHKRYDQVAKRAQVKFWHAFAETHNVAFADVTERWIHLDREGLRPDLMQVDEIIHPNDRGHEIYAEEIFKCFQ